MTASTNIEAGFSDLKTQSSVSTHVLQILLSVRTGAAGRPELEGAFGEQGLNSHYNGSIKRSGLLRTPADLSWRAAHIRLYGWMMACGLVHPYWRSSAFTGQGAAGLAFATEFGWSGSSLLRILLNLVKDGW
jgi:hypothetical protein